ncbi:YndM family protein [Natribacillus halophilus]|nr:YndM family protein [Natribacillus halophilus]
MKHVGAVIIKFLMMTFVLWFIFGLFGDVSFANILLISVVLTGVSYLVGDLYVLSNFGNTAATIADVVIAWLGIWALGNALFPNWGLFWLALLTAATIAVFEAFFHIYMEKIVLTDEDSTSNDTSSKHLQTEFGSDMDVKSDAKKGNKNRK